MTLSLADAQAPQAGQYLRCGDCGPFVGPSDPHELTQEGAVLCSWCAVMSQDGEPFTYPEPGPRLRLVKRG